VSDEPRGNIRAAGGLVVRPGRTEGDAEIALVHRKRYDDWTLPKGKLDPGESEEAAALREVEEETGLRCRLVRFLDRISYNDSAGRPKTVAYWLMEPVEGELRPDHEIDDVRWAPAADAASLLTYPRDAEVVSRALGNGPGAG
jgi:8-oxo-dGTP diphosphatase